MAKHLDRLAESLPSVGPAWDGFRALIESRVAEGQRRYGDRWLRLELIDEALEELADCCAYVAAEAHNHSEQDVDLSLTASHHALLAAEALATLRAKRCGSP